jgi:methyltransferase
VKLGVVVFGFMLVEARRAARNERAQRERGGIEAEHDVYSLMRVVYPGAFAAMIAEGFLRGGPGARSLASGLTLFACAKALKWWAIVTLGPAWTFRVIVVPGAPLVSSGPYRRMRHPNYVAVVGELVGVALMTGAAMSGPASTIAFMALLSKRIRVEAAMLDAAQRALRTSKSATLH